MVGDLGQGDAAVFGELEEPPGLGTHQNGHHVDQDHQQAGEDAGGEHILGDGVIIVDVHAADDVDDHDAESQARNGVHGAVALDQRREEGIAAVGFDGLDGRDRGAGREQGRNDQHGKENQKERVDDLADPDGDLTGSQGEKEDKAEEHRRENQQKRPFWGIFRQQGRNAGGEGDGGASGNGEQGADGQIEQAGEENAVALAYLTGQGLQAVGMSDGDGGYAKDGDANRGDDKADGGGYCIAAGHLAQVNGEDQVSGAKEHAEQRSGHKQSLLDRQPFSHRKINSFMLKSYTMRLQK